MEASHIITKFNLFGIAFPPIEIFVQLIEQNQTLLAKQVLETNTHLRKRAIEKICHPKYAKVAGQLVKDYKMSPTEFPELMRIMELQSAHYFISRAFKPETDSQHMYLHKVEELFEGYPLMLEALCNTLLKKEFD